MHARTFTHFMFLTRSVSIVVPLVYLLTLSLNIPAIHIYCEVINIISGRKKQRAETVKYLSAS